MDKFILKTKDGELTAEGFANHASFQVARGTLTVKVLPPEDTLPNIKGIAVRIEEMFGCNKGSDDYYHISFMGQILFNPVYVDVKEGKASKVICTFYEERSDVDLAEHIADRYIEGSQALEHTN